VDGGASSSSICFHKTCIFTMTKPLVFVWLLSFAAMLGFHNANALALKNPVKSWTRDIAVGYDRRVAADPSFPAKSVAEVFLAAGTQFTAEWQRRGASQLLPEIDFVLAGVLTAVAGKYYSMWKVAKTQLGNATTDASLDQDEPRLGRMKVPTNAFQSTLLDGVTRPSIKQRLGSLVAPVVPLFRAGIFASLIGYGLTAGMISMRSFLVPSYLPVTRQVNIVYACVYTGAFMAVFSNLRYQVLQGAIEPAVDAWLARLPFLRGVVIFTIRIGNGLLGSILAISGMRWLGLQKLK
jgi:hypothetical protein